MKKIALALAVILLVSTVYIGAVSVVGGQKLRPPTIKYIISEITSYEYYVNVGGVITDIEGIWNNNTSSIPSVGGGEEGSGGGRFPEDTPSWVISFSAWLEQSIIGRVFLTIASVIEFVVLSIYDTVLALLYLFKIMSVFLTGIPV